MNQNATQNTGTDQAAATPEAAKTPGATDSPGEPPRRLRSWKSALAIIVLGLLAVAAGLLWMQQREAGESEQNIGQLQDDILAQTANLQQLESQINALQAAAAERKTASERLANRLARQQRQLEELPLQLERLERSIENLPGVSNEARRSWLLAEAIYYMQLANVQITLMGNPDVALTALLLADEKLRDLADPGLSGVRSVLNDEITALNGVPRPDTEGMVLRLASLARNLSRLPVKNFAPDHFGKDATVSVEGGSGMDRAVQVIQEAFASIISVKPTDETAVPMMSAAENALLRQSLALELQIARLALLRDETTAFRRSLDAVREGLLLYFDTDSQQVKSMLDTIEELDATDLPAELPDITGSLSLIRQQAGETVRP